MTDQDKSTSSFLIEESLDTVSVEDFYYCYNVVDVP